MVNNREGIQSCLLSEAAITAFCLSLSMLLFISILKYFMNNESKKRDWGELLLELPIDICTIIITMLISLSYNVNPQNTFIAVFVTLIVAALCCYFRKKALSNSMTENYWLMTLYAICDIVACLGCCIFIVLFLH
mgnify:CR=1 FL=1